MVDVEPQEGAEEVVPVLAVALGVAATPAIAVAGVEIAVGAERHMPAVVVAVGLLHLDDDLLGGGVEDIRIRRRS